MSAQEDFAQARAWAQIDHRLVSLKIQGAINAYNQKADRMPDAPKGNAHGRFVAWADRSIEQANEWAEKVYAIYLEVLEKQHKARTPAFLRAVFQLGLVPVIEGKMGAAESNITITAKRIGMTVSLPPVLARLAQEKSRLVSRWRTRIEIEARELELMQGVLPTRTYPSEDDAKRMWESAAAQAACLHASISPPRLARQDAAPARPFQEMDTATLRAKLQACQSRKGRLLEAFPSLKTHRHMTDPPEEEREYQALLEEEKQLKLKLLRRGESVTLPSSSVDDQMSPEAAKDARAGASAAARSPIRGERDPEVAARRAELRNMLRGEKPVAAKEICKRWDSTGRRVPEKWREKGLDTWERAYADRHMKPNVKKLISTDKSRIQGGR